MEKVDGEKNTGLRVILCGLVLAVIGLIAGIVAVNLNKGSSDDIAISDEKEIEVTEDDLYEGETIEDARKRLLQDEQWKEIEKGINDEVEKLLDNESIDVDAINKIYNDGIEKANEWGRHDYVVDLVISRTDNFLSKGLKREALDAMLTIDPEIFDNVEKYYYYSNIIEIAQELGEQDLVSKYDSARKEIEGDFMAQSEETRSFAEYVGADDESYVGKEE